MPKLGLGLSLPQTRVSGGSLIPASGLSLWLKADAGVTLSGSNVTAWADQSGNGLNVVPDIVTADISLASSVEKFNNKPAILFGVQNNNGTVGLFNSNPFINKSLFIVYSLESVDNFEYSVAYENNGFSGQTSDNNGNRQFGGYFNGFISANTLSQIGTPYIRTTISDNGNTISFFINGTADGNPAGNGFYNARSEIVIGNGGARGSGPNPSISQPFQGYIAEIVVYNSVLTTPERQQVEAYLMNKYNITPPVFSRAFDSLGDQVGASNLGDIPTSWVANQTTVTSVIFANDNSVTSIGSDAFGYCNLSGITIPNSVTDIGSFAFQYTALTNITIPNSVTSIGANAFQYCTSLATVTIGTGVTSVSERMFQGCTSLTSITIPNSVTSIGSYAFYDCTSLATATIGTGVTSLPTQAFVSTGLTAITIPNTITSLGQESFKNCTSLASITFTAPSTLTSLGNYTFSGCTSLTSITIPPSVTSIGSYSFAFSGFTTINIPNTVTSIGEYAFKTSTSLATVTIGTGVTSVADYAFDGCTSLATVLCYVAQSALTSLGAYYTFRGTASPLTIRARSTDASWTAGTGLGFLGNANVTVIKNL